MGLGETWRRLVGGAGGAGSAALGGDSVGASAEGLKRILGNARGLIGSSSLPIAIDFGTGSLKVLQVEGDGPALVAAACVPTPDDLLSDAPRRLAFQLEALPRLARSVELKGRRAVCAIPAGHAFCKHMQFQVEAGVTIPALVRSAIPAQLGCDPSALVFRHVEVGPAARSGKTEVICLAAARELVERLMRTIKDCRLDPVGMHVEYSAALRAFDRITRRTEDEALTSLYLDMGAGSTKATVAHGRELVFARTIDVGGRHLDTAVARQLKCGMAEARAHRLAMAEVVGVKARSAGATANGTANGRVNGAAAHAGGGQEMAAGRGPGGTGGTPVPLESTAVAEDRRQGAVAPGLTGDLASRPRMEFAPPKADLSEPLEILTDEISMCLRYHGSVFPGRRVDRAIFFGGEARHLGLCQHIARTLRLPAQVADPMAGIVRSGREATPGVDLGNAQPGWALALGLCLSPTDL